MKSDGINLRELQAKTTEQEKSPSATYEIFAERNIAYLNPFPLFISYFNSIPHCIEVKLIACNKAIKWFTEAYKNDIKDFHFAKRQFNDSKSEEFDDIFYIIFEDLLINFDTSGSNVRFLFRKTDIERVEAIVDAIKKFKERPEKHQAEIFLLTSSINGIEPKAMNITKPKISIEDNYNDDFLPIHQTIIKRLSTKQDKGIVLLHGKPGTGKTFYIRHLISTVKKKAIFLPPNLARTITNPELMSILISNPNSIFVIEDAETIIVDRERNGNSPVSALLNISDGLLSDCLNIQIICSFNTDISKIDSALMRKGRLIAKYEFKELEVEKARRLSKKLGIDANVNSPMTLAAIYNQDERDFRQLTIRNPIGFKKAI